MFQILFSVCLVCLKFGITDFRFFSLFNFYVISLFFSCFFNDFMLTKILPNQERINTCELISHCSTSHSVQFSHSFVSDYLQPHGLQHTRLPCPSPPPGACSNSCPLSRWCHLTISSSVVPFSSHLQSFPASGSFLRSQLFASGGQSIGVSASASVLPMNIQDWFPLGWTGWISLQFHESLGKSTWVCSVFIIHWDGLCGYWPCPSLAEWPWVGCLFPCLLCDDNMCVCQVASVVSDSVQLYVL